MDSPKATSRPRRTTSTGSGSLPLVNRAGGRLYAGLLLMATIALLAPSAVADLDLAQGEVMAQKLSAGLAVLLIVAYGLALLFSLKTHKELFASADHGDKDEAPWPLGLAVGTLLVVTVLVPLVSEIFVGSVQKAGEALGMSPAFVGFIIVALVGAAAEMAVAFSPRAQGPPRYECQHRTWECLPDRSVRGSGTRAHQLRCRSETNGLAVLAGRGDDGDDFCCHGILHFEQRPLGMVYRRFAIIHIRNIRDNPLCGAAGSARASVIALPNLRSTMCLF
jgi:hypothetical protein